MRFRRVVTDTGGAAHFTSAQRGFQHIAIHALREQLTEIAYTTTYGANGKRATMKRKTRNVAPITR